MTLDYCEKVSRIGLRWSDEEDDDLLEDIENIKDLNKIALKHKRTVCSIESRIMYHIVFPIYKDKIYQHISEISEYYNMDNDTIIKYAEKVYRHNDILV
jgi:hypothetical protein